MLGAERDRLVLRVSLETQEALIARRELVPQPHAPDGFTSTLCGRRSSEYAAPRRSDAPGTEGN